MGKGRDVIRVDLAKVMAMLGAFLIGRSSYGILNHPQGLMGVTGNIFKHQTIGYWISLLTCFSTCS